MPTAVSPLRYPCRAVWTHLDDLDAFYLEHRRCGKLDAHVEDRRAWIISGGHFDEAGEFPEGSIGSTIPRAPPRDAPALTWSTTERSSHEHRARDRGASCRKRRRVSIASGCGYPGTGTPSSASSPTSRS